jgi:hypothetical protein
LPTSVVREVSTEPAVKGDTSGKVMKPAKIATGFEIAVPLFVENGDKIEIDTRTHEYRKRALTWLPQAHRAPLPRGGAQSAWDGPALDWRPPRGRRCA